MTSRIVLLHELSQHVHQASMVAQTLEVPILAYLFNMAKLEILDQIKGEYLANRISDGGTEDLNKKLR
jgi:hypothetical protein